MNEVFVTAWPEKQAWAIQPWTKHEWAAFYQRACPGFKTVRFLPEVTEDDKKRGAAFYRVNLHENGNITFDKAWFTTLPGNIIDEIEGVTKDPHLYIVVDVEEDECYGKWMQYTLNGEANEWRG